MPILAQRREKEKEQKTISGFIASIIGTLTVVMIIRWLWPSVIPFTVFEAWQTKGPILDAIKYFVPAFIWAGSINLVVLFSTRNTPEVNRDAEDILIAGFLISAMAGILEEIGYRWAIFLSAIWGIKLVNWIFLGIPEWFYNTVVGPIANLTTLGFAEHFLFHPEGWFVGAAVIGSNAKFRDGHKYQGWFGFVNSWFIGIYLFWIMFNYGLPAAILVHFLYDMLIFSLAYVDAAIERARGF